MNRAKTTSLSSPVSSSRPDSLSKIEEFIEAYESSRALGKQTNLLDYLPSPDSDLYRPTASELIRVDMEYSWEQRQNKRLLDYRKLLPDVLDDPEVLGQVAFEEYRLRVQAGEQVSFDEYHKQYGIETNGWPRWNTDVAHVKPTRQDDSPQGSEQGSSIDQLWQEAMELADDVQDFPTIGEKFLDFELQQELGRGAFARVYLARQGELADRPVVLKIASGHSLEPQHLARLQHTNIVPIYSVHRHDNLTAVCMPYYGARTMADLLTTVRQKSAAIASEQNLISTFFGRADPTKLPASSSATVETSSPSKPPSKIIKALAESNYVDAVIWLMKQIAEGLSHAHSRGIIHRDIKPANILLTEEGLPMILDFNLSEDVVVNGRTSLLVGGTLPYMSPEHLQAVSSGGQVDFQTDIFSLGVIFYELLTGERPFPDRSGAFDDVVREMISDRQGSCPSVLALNRAVPPSVASVVNRCLAPHGKDRYRSSEELTEDLQRHLHNQPLRHVADRSIAERSKKWLKRHPRISSGGGVAAIAAVGLLLMFGLLFMRGQRLDRLNAESMFQAFRRQQPLLTMALGVPHSEAQILEDSIATTRESLESYGVLDNRNWREQTAYKALPAATQLELNRRMGELLYLVARANDQLPDTVTEAKDRTAILDESLELNRLALEVYTPDSCPRALLLQRASLLEEKGSHDAAEKLREQATHHSTKDVIDQYADVYKLLDARNYRQAKPLLIALRDHSPTDPVPWLLLGDANAALGALAESEGCLTTAIALRPESYMGYYHRGRCHMDQKRYEDALMDFEQVIRLRPQLACGILNRALAHKAMGNYVEATADLTRALELGATQTRIYFLRSDLRRRVGDKAGAAQDFETGLARTPSDELSWVTRGVARLKRDPAAALSDYRHALQLNPFSTAALRNSVHVLADRLNRRQEAMQALNQLLALDENDPDALAGRSVLYARQGDRTAALADVEQLLRVSKRPKAIFQAACALSLNSNPENSDASKAMVLLARAVQLEPRWLARARTDPDLKNVRQTEGFQKFVTDFHKMNSPNLNFNQPLEAASIKTDE